MADGRGNRWNNYKNTPKHLVDAWGEPLLARTVRQIHELDEGAEVIITSHDPAYDLEGAVRIEPAHNELEIDRFTEELIGDEVCFLYGDAVYSRKALQKIIRKDLGDITFYGNSQSILAIKVKNGDVFREHYHRVRKMVLDGALEDARGWQVYQSYAGLPIGQQIEIGDYFLQLGTCSFDINTPEEYEQRFAKKTRKKVPVWKKIRRKKNVLLAVIKLMCKGYSYTTAKQWGRKIHNDLVAGNGVSRKDKKWAHKRGFLSGSIEKYGLADSNYMDYVSDFEFFRVSPLNNAYTKWLTDRLTPGLILQPLSHLIPKVYYNIIRRNSESVVIDISRHDVVPVSDIIKTVRSGVSLLMEPSETKYYINSYLLKPLSGSNGEIEINGEACCAEELEELIDGIGRYYVIREYVENRADIREVFGSENLVFRMLVANVEDSGAKVLRCFAETRMPYTGGAMTSTRSELYKQTRLPIDLDTGCIRGVYSAETTDAAVPGWDLLLQAAKEIGAYVSEIKCFEIFLKLTDRGPIAVAFGAHPALMADDSRSSAFGRFVLDELQRKTAGPSMVRKRSLKSLIAWRMLRIAKKKYFRKGFREYMLATWLLAVKDDLLHTKTTSIRQKVWAWKRGFLSFRIDQYGLTEENWRTILSDYEYAWLNRINNSYQKWINDKLTMRYVLAPLKEYLPEYYYFAENRRGKLFLKELQDLPEGYRAAKEDVIRLLEEKKKLVFKPNAGTHGDGFYKFEYEAGEYFINGEAVHPEDILRTLSSQKSTYVITDYLVMHPELAKIYPASVNTVRLMVINQNCTEPVIMQSYMRVGSSRTGITDNIAYGGFAVYVDKESGHYDRAALLLDHKYTPMDHHPDTGTLMVGDLPNWETVKKGVIAIARQIPQIEYMGFDVVITESGFKILEINIHQDIHKAHEFTPEVNAFFKLKKAQKMGVKTPASMAES